VDDLDYGAKTVEQFAVLVPIALEFHLSSHQDLEDVVRRVAVLKFIRGRMFDKFHPGLLGIAVECGLEDGLKTWRGSEC
jgi:hypothetical protein